MRTVLISFILFKFKFIHSRLNEALDRINKRLDEQQSTLTNIQNQLSRSLNNESKPQSTWFNLNVVSIIILTLGVVFHAIFMWMLAKKQLN